MRGPRRRTPFRPPSPRDAGHVGGKPAWHTHGTVCSRHCVYPTSQPLAKSPCQVPGQHAPPAAPRCPPCSLPQW